MEDKAEDNVKIVNAATSGLQTLVFLSLLILMRGLRLKAAFPSGVLTWVDKLEVRPLPESLLTAAGGRQGSGA